MSSLLFRSGSEVDSPLIHPFFRLMGKDRMHELNPEQQVFARDADGGLSLLDLVKKEKPTILVGVTAVGGE